MIAPLRLLLIDDDVGLTRLTARALLRLGIETTVTNSGAEGVEALTTGTARFDAVALDHVMPGQDGLETLAQIQALLAPPPVIYVTGTNEGRVAIAALKAGAADYVVKDIGDSYFELLARTIASAVTAESTRAARDAAEQATREALARAETLLQEVNHRVANSLQLVVSLVRMQMATEDDPGVRHALGIIQSRIAAVAQIHRRLYTSTDVRSVRIDEYLAALAAELQESIGAEAACSIRVRADAVEMPADKAVSVGVIVNELITNAVKYAYPGSGGEVRVTLDSAPETVTLAVEDDGVGYRGITGGPRGTGLGSRIVTAMASGLASEVRYDSTGRGTRASMTLAA